LDFNENSTSSKMQVGDLVKYENWLDDITRYGIVVRGGHPTVRICFCDSGNESWVSTEYLEVISESR